ncbi:uracil-DNA glycosylase [Pedobacter steynii]
MSITLEKSWLNELSAEFEKDYIKALKTFLQQEKQKGFTVYPKGSEVFNALDHTPFNKVKVVILGQDPYHGQGQAHGLSFSVQKGITVPPSLKNIYKELATDIEGFSIPTHGNLTKWADEGVLLLNATLTVRAHEAGSHQGKGWEIFTDKIISQLSTQREGLVFLLWGRYAQNKSALIDQTKHTILAAAHPLLSQLIMDFLKLTFFQGKRYFGKQGLSPIDWQIT